MNTASPDHCETCGKTTPEMWWCHDTLFCAECWKDFGTVRWKGIGSKKETDTKGQER